MRTNTSISHRIIAVLIAAWIPFCCCTLKVAASIVQDADAAPVSGSCCCSLTTMQCDGEAPDSDERSGGTCTLCCLKVMPESAEDWDPPMVSLWLPQSDATTGLPVNADGPEGFHPPTHPPDRSPRITLLEQRSLLLL